MSSAALQAFLTLDVGSSSVKAAVVAAGGRMLAVASTPTPYAPPNPDAPHNSEIEPEGLWAAVTQVALRVLADPAAGAAAIAAVGVTSQRQAIGALDREGTTMFLGPNMDLRAFFEGVVIDNEQAGRVYTLFGHLPSFLLGPAKLLWRMRNDPEVYDAIHAVVTAADWVGYRLTGELAMQETLGVEAGLLELGSGLPPTEFLSSLGLRTDFCPPVSPPLTPLGGLTAAASRALGLAAGLPVMVAGPDSQCGLAALGVAETSDLGIIAGWSAAVQAVTPAPRHDPARRTWVGRHVVPGQWIAEATTGDAGASYAWMTALLCGDGDDAFARMTQLVAEAPPGSDGVVAMLGPVPLDMSRVGMRSGGLVFPVPVNYAYVDRARLARAALENVAFALRGAVETLVSITGVPPRSVAVGGGMTRTQPFVQAMADILPMDVYAGETPDITLQGAALVAEAAVSGKGAFERLIEAVRLDRTPVPPEHYARAECEEAYGRWLEAQSRLEGIF